MGTEAWKKHLPAEAKWGGLVTATADLVTSLGAPGTDLINPSGFVKEFITYARTVNEDIRFGRQADADEAIELLMDALHTSLGREVNMNLVGTPLTTDQKELIQSLTGWTTYFKKAYSPFVENFFGQTQTKIVCEQCKTCSTRYEPWSMLKLPIPGADKVGNPAPSLADCITAAFRTEHLDDYSCDKCAKKGPANIITTISRFPQHLILVLKRYTNAGSKVRARIAYDAESVPLAPWRTWSLQGTPSYRVMSTLEHLGGSGSGHYVMRNRESDGWWLYNDGRVHKTDGASGPDTYILFLEQIASP
jgi:ubiquitin carboxyl-terminal hydrolase 8